MIDTTQHFMKQSLKFTFIFAGLLFINFFSWAQTTSDSKSLIDSLIQQTDAADTSVAQVPRPSLEASIKRTREFTLELNSVNQALRNTIDTVEINEVLYNANQIITLVQSRLGDTETRINLRYINALDNLLTSISSQTNDKERQIQRRVDELSIAKSKLDEIKQDDIMGFVFRDTTLLPEYQRSLNDLFENVQQTDSTINAKRLKVATFQSRISNATIQISELMEGLNQQRIILERALLKKENNFIWERPLIEQKEKLTTIFVQSIRLNQVIVTRFIWQHFLLTIVLILGMGGLYYWVHSNLQKVRSEKEFASIILGRIRYTPKYPLISCVLVVLAIAPFFYSHPPNSFFAVVLFIMIFISGVLIRIRIGKQAFLVWLCMYFLFVISLLSNLYTVIVFQERWYLLFFSIIGILLMGSVLKIHRESENDLPLYLGVFSKIYIGFQIVSIIANVLGRFSFAKMLGITATISLMHAISLVIFVIIIKEFIYLQIEASRKNHSEFTSVIEFYDVQRRINRIFTFLAIAIWGYYFLESLSLLDTIVDGTFAFLRKQRHILNAVFTFEQIAVFVIVIYFSTFLANTIAYAASIKDEQNAGVRNKRLGSSILLIRLAVFTIGFLIAFAASGIPIDKIAIVLGALSVGIGFGLQTIVNNLVSGVILAFERPIQIGDTIQVGTIEGVVKDIGIRASKIRNWDGADVIIPNGDLLAEHLTNWTLSDKKRRVELLIGVSYDSDTELVTSLIKQELSREKIMSEPPQRVFMQKFGDNSIDFRVLFWVEDVDFWIVIRDDVMRGIYKAFKANNVEIPFPQRDLYIKSFPGIKKEIVSKPADLLKEEAYEEVKDKPDNIK